MSAIKKTALVTGAAKRIGRVIAQALARQQWQIVVHYHHSADEAAQLVDEIKMLGQNAVAIHADLAKPDAPRTLLQEAHRLLGPVRCVVNNASLFAFDTSEHFSHDNLNAHMHINLAAPVLLAQILYETIEEEQQGVVINLLDQKLFNLNPDFFSYTISKAALECATRMQALALAPKVRVVGVAPGITLPSGMQSVEHFKQTHCVTPLNYSSTPEDIAHAVCFVAEAKAITGTTLLVDGGQHLWPLKRDVIFTT